MDGTTMDAASLANGQRPQVARPRLEIRTEDDDFSEQSPEPSPMSVPQPLSGPMKRTSFQMTQQQRQGPTSSEQLPSTTPRARQRPVSESVATPITPDSDKDQNKQNGHEVIAVALDGADPTVEEEEEKKEASNGSVGDPHLPEAPLPASPPPSSLFSSDGSSANGEDHHRTARRRTRSTVATKEHRPMSEVRLWNQHKSAHNQNLSSQQSRTSHRQSGYLEDENQEQASVTSSIDVSTTVQQARQSSRLSRVRAEKERSSFQPQASLVPAVLQLKQDLHTAHQALYLLQQENKALEHELTENETAYREAQQALEAEREERRVLEETYQRQHEEANAALKEQEATNDELRSKVQQAETLLGKAENQVKAMRQRDSEIESLECELGDCQQALQQKVEECSLIQTELQERQLSLANALAQRDALQDELDSCRDVVERQACDREEFNEKLREEATYWKEELSAAHRAYRAQLDDQANMQRQWVEQLQEREATLTNTNATVAELRAEKLALRHELSQHLRKVSVGVQTSSPIEDDEEEDDDDDGIEEEVTEMEQGTQTEPIIPPSSKGDAVRKDVAILRERQQELERQYPMQQDVPNQPEEEDTPETHVDEEAHDLANDPALLVKIREDLVKVVTEQALSAVKASLVGPTVASSDDSAAVLAERIKNELKQAVKEETLLAISAHFAASSQPSGEANEPHTGEKMPEEDHTSVSEQGSPCKSSGSPNSNASRPNTAGRCSPKSQDSTSQSAEPVMSGLSRNKNRHEQQDLQSLQRDWENETNHLLDSIQRECNEVFERTRTQRSRTSPRTVALQDLTVLADGQASSSPNLFSSTPPPVDDYVDLDRTLDETEALVRSLLNPE